MATSFLALTRSILDSLAEDLKNDLHVLEHQMKLDKSGMFITHDGESTLMVYAEPRYRAYVPKKYEGLDVKFVDWDPNDDEIQLDLDDDIDYFED